MWQGAGVVVESVLDIDPCGVARDCLVARAAVERADAVGDGEQLDVSRTVIDPIGLVS